MQSVARMVLSTLMVITTTGCDRAASSFVEPADGSVRDANLADTTDPQPPDTTGCTVVGTIAPDSSTALCPIVGLGLLASTNRVIDIGVSASEDVYLIRQDHSVQRLQKTGDCAYQLVPFTPPTGADWQRVEGTSDGRMYFVGINADDAYVLAWTGPDAGACVSPAGRRFGAAIGAADDRKVLFSNATGTGAAIVDTNDCSISAAAFASTIALGAVGRMGRDFLVGDRNIVNFLGRYSMNGATVFEQSNGYAGSRSDNLHVCGGNICTFTTQGLSLYRGEDGSLLNRRTGAELFGSAVNSAAASLSYLDSAPDGSYAIVLAQPRLTTECDYTPLMYRLQF